MKRFTVYQYGDARFPVERNFVVDVPDSWDEEDVERHLHKWMASASDFREESAWLNEDGDRFVGYDVEVIEQDIEPLYADETPALEIVKLDEGATERLSPNILAAVPAPGDAS